MHVKLIPYSEIFVTVTMSLDEATMLVDSLEVSGKSMPREVQHFLTAVRTETEAALVRAQTLQEKRSV